MSDVALQSLCEGWAGSLVFEQSGSGSSLAYLDLQLSLDHRHRRVNWTLFEKPMAKHLYLAWTSSHDRSVHKAVVAGGAKRIWTRCNGNKLETNKHIDRFMLRLVNRGYPRHIVKDIVDRTLNSLTKGKENRD